MRLGIWNGFVARERVRGFVRAAMEELFTGGSNNKADVCTWKGSHVEEKKGDDLRYRIKLKRRGGNGGRRKVIFRQNPPCTEGKLAVL